jgi:hypothetical protein
MIKGLGPPPLPTKTHASVQPKTISIDLGLLLRRPSHGSALEMARLQTAVMVFGCGQSPSPGAFQAVWSVCSSHTHHTASAPPPYSTRRFTVSAEHLFTQKRSRCSAASLRRVRHLRTTGLRLGHRFP